MSEFNPEQPLGNRSPDLPEKPQPAEKSQKQKRGTRIGRFLDKPITRRDLLKLGGAAAAAYLLKDIHSPQEIDPDRYKTPEKVLNAIKSLEDMDLQLPQDPLYGFGFPSTREMAKKYQEALSTKIEGSPFDSSLVVIQEKKPETITQAMVDMIPPLGKIFGIFEKSEVPHVLKGEPDYLYLPPYVARDSLVETAVVLYHEGLHVFFQEGESDGSNQTTFNREIMPNIGNILLDRLLQSNGYELKRYYTKDYEAYDQAIRDNNREVWEQHLKTLYKLPQDCCTYQPPVNQPLSR